MQTPSLLFSELQVHKHMNLFAQERSIYKFQQPEIFGFSRFEPTGSPSGMWFQLSAPE
jgi:hypothetical protein